MLLSSARVTEYLSHTVPRKLATCVAEHSRLVSMTFYFVLCISILKYIQDLIEHCGKFSNSKWHEKINGAATSK